MEYELPGHLQSQQTELLKHAKDIKPSHDGCKDASNATVKKTKKKTLNAGVKKLAKEYQKVIMNKSERAPRLRASGVHAIVTRQKEDCRPLVRKMLNLARSESDSEEEETISTIEDSSEDEDGELPRPTSAIRGMGGGRPSGSPIHGAVAEKCLVESIEKGTKSKSKAFPFNELKITFIDKSKVKSLHGKYPYIVGSPDGKIDFTLEKGKKTKRVFKYENALLEIKSTSDPTAIVKYGKIVETHRTYYQVLVMLEVLNLEYCLVLVTIDGGKNIRSFAVVNRAPNVFKDDILPKLRSFYIGWLLPEIVHPMLLRDRRVKLRSKSLGDWVEI